MSGGSWAVCIDTIMPHLLDNMLDCLPEMHLVSDKGPAMLLPLNQTVVYLHSKPIKPTGTSGEMYEQGECYNCRPCSMIS